MTTPNTMREPGYALLAAVLQRAYDQAAIGKGKERHASAAPFEEQSTQQIMQLLETSDGATHQAIKKLVEARRLPPDAATRERLGAIIYIASAIIMEERKAQPRQAAPGGRRCTGTTDGSCMHTTAPCSAGCSHA